MLFLRLTSLMLTVMAMPTTTVRPTRMAFVPISQPCNFNEQSFHSRAMGKGKERLSLQQGKS
jgi:hypothetical protein